MSARDDWVLWALAVGIVVTVFFAGLAAYLNAKDCENKGGKMEQDGTFTYVWVVTNYKTGAGIMQPQPNYVCKVPQ